MFKEFTSSSIDIEDLAQIASHEHELLAIDWYYDNCGEDPETIVERFIDQAAVRANFTPIDLHPETRKLVWNPQLLGKVNGKERLRLCSATLLPASSVGLIQFIVGAAMCHIENEDGQDIYYIPYPRTHGSQDVLIVLTKSQFEETLSVALSQL